MTRSSSRKTGYRARLGTVWATNLFMARNLATKHGWITGGATEPLTKALAIAGAELVDTGESRTLGENASLIRPLVGRDFQVRASPVMQARDGKECQEWRLGAGLGPNASGAYPRRVFDLGATHPGI